MYQRWPGGPTEAEALRRALGILSRADALANLLPSVVLFVLPTSLLFGLLASRASTLEAPITTPKPRWVAVAALTSTAFGITVAGWVMPAANQNYREIVFSSVTGTERRENVPVKGPRELTLDELGDAIRTEEATNGPHLALYRTERHKRVAIPAACAVFALVGIGLAGGRRWRNTIVIALATVSVGLVHYVLIRLGEQLLMPRGASPFVCAWIGNLVLAAVGAILIVRRNARTRSSLEVSSPAH